MLISFRYSFLRASSLAPKTVSAAGKCVSTINKCETNRWESSVKAKVDAAATKHTFARILP